MAVPGVYSDAEKKMLEDFEKTADERQGWVKLLPGSPFTTDTCTVTLDALLSYGYEKDPWNPFWSSVEYATSSRWGGVIAHPWYVERYKPPEKMIESPKNLFRTFYLMGHDIELYQPIRPGDIIRTWQRRPTLEDSTDPTGNGPRKFRYVDGDADMVNQRDEIICIFKQYVEVTLHEDDFPVDKYLGDYGYTQKELDYIAEMTEAEKPRSQETLLWEDINVGDRPQPIANGPTPFTTMNFSDIPSEPTGQIQRRAFVRYEEQTGGPIMFGYVRDRKTGLIYPVQGGRHNNDRAAQFEGGPQAWLFNFEPRFQMTRLVTNWIGDDGFVCKLGWRHVFRTPVGDTLIARGEVIKKYIENNEHLVDLRIWCTDLRGTITDMALSTVKLVSKEDNYPSFKKVIKR